MTLTTSFRQFIDKLIVKENIRRKCNIIREMRILPFVFLNLSRPYVGASIYNLHLDTKRNAKVVKLPYNITTITKS